MIKSNKWVSICFVKLFLSNNLIWSYHSSVVNVSGIEGGDPTLKFFKSFWPYCLCCMKLNLEKTYCLTLKWPIWIPYVLCRDIYFILKPSLNGFRNFFIVKWAISRYIRNINALPLLKFIVHIPFFYKRYRIVCFYIVILCK